MALDARTEDFVRIALPPVVRRKDLDFVRPPVACGFHPGPDQRNVDHTVTHHAAIEEEIGCGHQPIADVECQQSPGMASRALDLGCNLFDTAPPYTNAGGQNYFQAGYDPGYADPRLRTFILSATYKFK